MLSLLLLIYLLLLQSLASETYLLVPYLGFSWDIVNFPASSCCVLDLVRMLITVMFSVVAKKSSAFSSLPCSANEQVCRNWGGAQPDG